MILPTISFPRLWHVGSLDPSHKRQGSFEGSCLSVSTCPQAWREIAGGFVDGPCYVATSASIKMLDAHALDDDMKTSILAWGVANGYAEACDIWTVSYYDDEAEDEAYFPLDSLADAEAEASEILDLDEDDPEYRSKLDSAITPSREHRGTAKLHAAARQNMPVTGDANTLDILLPLWVESETHLSGVWWQDRFDPSNLSAPRGGIIPLRLDRLQFITTKDEPYEPCEEEMETA